ncbi:phosphoribosyltransferase [Neorhizobium sp. LjRoot104]|uniref:phosphoribosyltransferase n=1 Tax=Neorhizobium sp. LjRoot104 TaxID=3342254 RepID=UPI003ECCCC94
MFIDRNEAGRRLAQALKAYQGSPCTIFALPRGGVPVAAEVAKALNAPLAVLLVRKIGVPGNPEVAMGAVIDGKMPIVVRNDDIIARAGISSAVFESCCRLELDEIHRRRLVYAGCLAEGSLSGRTAVIVDDGLATGATATAAIRGLRVRNPTRIMLAVPVAPPEVVARLKAEADEVICLETPCDFGAVGDHYLDFRQLNDEAVLSAFPGDRG